MTFSPLSERGPPADRKTPHDEDDEATQAYSDEDGASKEGTPSPNPDPELQHTLTEHMDTDSPHKSTGPSHSGTDPPPCDPTMLYNLDTDTEDSPTAPPTSDGGVKPSSDSAGTGRDTADSASPSTVGGKPSDPASSDDDSTDIEEEAPVKSKPTGSEGEGEGKSEDQPEPVESGGSKLKPTESTAGPLSLMDYSEQGPPSTLTLGAGTLVLPSYEESCDQDGSAAVTKGTTVVLESYQSTCSATVPADDGETPLVKEEGDKSSETDKKAETSSENKGEPD